MIAMKTIKGSSIFALLLASSFLIHHNALAYEREISEPFTLSAGKQFPVFSPYRIDKAKANANSPSYRLYQIDYSDLKYHLSIYKKIYVTGQLLHGALMVKMKPKFVD